MWRIPRFQAGHAVLLMVLLGACSQYKLVCDAVSPERRLGDGCEMMYVDIGSNIGVQVRKLFQPQLYPGAAVLPYFAQYFGPPRERQKTFAQSRLCAIGFEANPSLAAKLQELQVAYTSRRSWHVEFVVPVFVTGSTDVLGADVPVYQPANHHIGTSMLLRDWLRDRSPEFHVKSLDLGAFLWEQHILPRRSVLFGKLDVEGAEFMVLPRLLSVGALCASGGGFQALTVEWHDGSFKADGRQEEDIRQGLLNTVPALNATGLPTRAELEEAIRTQPYCAQPTQLIDIDDEAYQLDGKPLPTAKLAAAPDHAWLHSESLVGRCPDRAARDDDADSDSWSCVSFLPDGPRMRPSHHPDYEDTQRLLMEFQPAVVPRWGATAAGMLKGAFTSNELRPFLDEFYKRRHELDCASRSDALHAEGENNGKPSWRSFNHYTNAGGVPPCRLVVENLPALASTTARVRELLSQWSNSSLHAGNQNKVLHGSLMIYPEGSVVAPHVDVLDTHHVSATLLVGTLGLRVGWPLEVAHWDYKQGTYTDTAAFYAQPGDLVSYQGARMEHSRPRPLQGTMYLCLIFHFKVQWMDHISYWHTAPVKTGLTHLAQSGKIEGFSPH